MVPQHSQWTHSTDIPPYPFEGWEEDFRTQVQQDRRVAINTEKYSFKCCHCSAGFMDQGALRVHRCQSRSIRHTTCTEFVSGQTKSCSKSSAQNKVRMKMGPEIEQKSKRKRPSSHRKKNFLLQHSSFSKVSEVSRKDHEDCIRIDMEPKRFCSYMDGCKGQENVVANRIGNNLPSDKSSLEWLAIDQLTDESEGLGRFRFWNWSDGVQNNSLNPCQTLLEEWDNKIPENGNEREVIQGTKDKGIFSSTSNVQVCGRHSGPQRVQEFVDESHELTEGIKKRILVEGGTHRNTFLDDSVLVQAAFCEVVNRSKDPSVINIIEQQFGSDVKIADDQNYEDLEFEHYRRRVLLQDADAPEISYDLEKNDVHNLVTFQSKENSSTSEREFENKQINEDCYMMSRFVWAEHSQETITEKDTITDETNRAIVVSQLENDFYNNIEGTSPPSDVAKSENAANANNVCEWFNKLLDGSSDTTSTELYETSHHLPLSEAARRDCISFFSMDKTPNL